MKKNPLNKNEINSNKYNKDLKKQLKISINDSSFNNLEMLKLYIYVKQELETKKIDSLILENINSRKSIVFNKKNINNFKHLLHNNIKDIEDGKFLEQLEIIDFSKTIKLHLIENERKILNNINIDNLIEPEKSILKINKDYYSNNIDFLIKDNYFNNKTFNNFKNYSHYNNLFINDFKQIYTNIKNSVFQLKLKNLFDLEYSEESKEQSMNEILNKYFSFDNINKTELLFIKQFITYHSINKEDTLTDIILEKLSKQYIDVVNEKIPKDLIYYFEIKPSVIFSKNTNQLKLIKKDKDFDIDLVEEIKKSPYSEALNLNLAIEQKIGKDIKESLFKKVKDFYFGDFSNNSNEQELNNFIENYINTNYNGDYEIATNNILNDNIVNFDFGNLITAYKKRIKNFANFKTKNLKHIIIVVDYDNDGTLAKLIIEELKNELIELFPEGEKHDDLIQIVFTKNYDGNRGLTEKDILDQVKNYDSKKEHSILVMTADNNPTLEELNKILNLKEVNKNKNETIKINTENVLINDHHPLDAKMEKELRKFYIENYKKVLFFNPEYKYIKNNIVKSGKKNISGASTFYHDYLEHITAISNIMDYINTKHSEISNPLETESHMNIARNMNLFIKYSIYFNNQEKLIEYYKDILKEAIHKNYSNNISTIGYLFIDSFFENDNNLLCYLFENDNKIETIKMINEKIKNIGPDYLSYLYKKENSKTHYSYETKKLDYLFNGSFDNLLKSFQLEYSVNKEKKVLNDNMNVEKIEIKDKDKKECIIFIDHSIPPIPKKLIMDFTRKDISNMEGVVFYGIIKDDNFVGSSRVSSEYNLPGFTINNFKFDFKGHAKAAGVNFSKKQLNILKESSKTNNNNFILNIDDKLLTQYVNITNIVDLEQLFNSRVLNNRKTGNLDIKYSIKLDDIKEQGFNIENFGTQLMVNNY